jgi:TPP-dependent pyruvate/acetoin dehydrogenase alpha subunit
VTQHFTPRVETGSEEELYLELYRRMWLIRRFEDEVQALFL